MCRATELDPSWAKGYSRLAEVYNAQAQYEKAVKAYERAISSSSGPEIMRYRGLNAKMKEKTRDVLYLNGAKYDPGRNGNDAMFVRFEAAVPDRWKFGMDAKNLTPLGYMTAADKIYSGYTPITYKMWLIWHRWIQWDSAMQAVPSAKVFGAAYIPGDLIQSMTNALIQDRRGFYLRNTKEELSRIITVIQTQYLKPHVLPAGTPVNEVVNTFKVLSTIRK
jgi:tetratricopeptide (TPR) repeat protein